MRDGGKNEMNSRTAKAYCLERVPRSWCKERLQMKPGGISDLRRWNQFLGRTRKLEFPKIIAYGENAREMPSESLAKNSLVNECKETTQSTNQYFEREQSPELSQAKNSFYSQQPVRKISSFTGHHREYLGGFCFSRVDV